MDAPGRAGGRPSHHDVSLLSDEVGDIISFRPHWIVRRGNGVVALVVAGLVAVATVVRYPDVVVGSVRLAASSAPKLAATRVDGRLERLLARNGTHVRRGQHLAVVQSTASYDEISALQAWIDAVTAPGGEELDRAARHPLPALSGLGEVQSGYQELQTMLGEAMQIRGSGYYERRRTALLKDLEYLAAMRLIAARQQRLQREDYQLQQTEFRAQEALGKARLIAPLELNQNRSRTIAKEQALEQVGATLIANDLTRAGKRKELLDLEKQVLDQQQRLHSALLTLRGRLAEWERQFVVAAPDSGTLVFSGFLEENQLLRAGQELFYVQSAGGTIHGEMVASQYGLGRIRLGQRVLVRVESFPSAEFGHLDGVVGYVSAMPVRADSFLIRVDLPDGLRTSQHRVIPLRDGLSARGEIVTDERRLVERLLGQLSVAVAR